MTTCILQIRNRLRGMLAVTLFGDWNPGQLPPESWLLIPTCCLLPQWVGIRGSLCLQGSNVRSRRVEWLLPHILRPAAGHG